jgi:hypothetical protein
MIQPKEHPLPITIKQMIENAAESVVDNFIPLQEEDVCAFYQKHSPFQIESQLVRAEVWKRIGKHWMSKDSVRMTQVVDGWLMNEELTEEDAILLWNVHLVRFASEPVLIDYLSKNHMCWITNEHLGGCQQRMNRILWEAFFNHVTEKDFWHMEDYFLDRKSKQFNFILPERLLRALFKKGALWDEGIQYVSCRYLMQPRLLEGWEIQILQESVEEWLKGEVNILMTFDPEVMLALIKRVEVGKGWGILDRVKECLDQEYAKGHEFLGGFWKDRKLFDAAWAGFEQRRLEEANGVGCVKRQIKVL